MLGAFATGSIGVHTDGRAKHGSHECNMSTRASAGLRGSLDLSSPAMSPSRGVLALFLMTSLGPACGDGRPPGQAGNDSSLVGGACADNMACDLRLCQTGGRFPRGICTISCGNSGQCPRGSSCAELTSGWVCLVDCAATADCRADYVCDPVTEAGTNAASTQTVCIGPASVP